MSEEYTPFKMKGFPTIQGTSPAKQVEGIATKGLKGAKNIIEKEKRKKEQIVKNKQAKREIDQFTEVEAGNDAYDKVKYSPKHGSKLKDKKGWTKTPGTNTWKNDAYEAKKENRKATEAHFKASSDESYKNKFGK